MGWGDEGGGVGVLGAHLDRRRRLSRAARSVAQGGTPRSPPPASGAQRREPGHTTPRRATSAPAAPPARRAPRVPPAPPLAARAPATARAPHPCVAPHAPARAYQGGGRAPRLQRANGREKARLRRRGAGRAAGAAERTRGGAGGAAHGGTSRSVARCRRGAKRGARAGGEWAEVFLSDSQRPRAFLIHNLPYATHLARYTPPFWQPSPPYSSGHRHPLDPKTRM